MCSLGEESAVRKAKRTLQNQRGHRKRTTDKVIQRYVNVDVVTCTVSQILSRVCI